MRSPKRKIDIVAYMKLLFSLFFINEDCEIFIDTNISNSHLLSSKLCRHEICLPRPYHYPIKIIIFAK